MSSPAVDVSLRRVMNKQFCSTMMMNDSSHFVSLALHLGVVVTYRKV